MSEIDKLVNRAYPDELRRVTPIAVDEGAILARTLEKLGLEEAKKPARRKKRRERYMGRHGARREPRLVEVVEEPPRRRWIGWAGWAAAACIAIACAVNFGPALLEQMLVYPETASDLAGAGAAGAYEAAEAGGGEAGAIEVQKEGEQTPRLGGYTAEDVAGGMDRVKAAALRIMGPTVHLLRLSRLDEKDQFSLVLYLPDTPQAQAAQYGFTVGGADLEAVLLSQSYQDDFVYLTYQVIAGQDNGHYSDSAGTAKTRLDLYIWNNAAEEEGLVQDAVYELYLGRKTSSQAVFRYAGGGYGTDVDLGLTPSPSPEEDYGGANAAMNFDE